MLTIVRYGDLWVNKVSVRFLQLDLKNTNNIQVQLYRLGINKEVHALLNLANLCSWEHTYRQCLQNRKPQMPSSAESWVRGMKDDEFLVHCVKWLN